MKTIRSVATVLFLITRIASLLALITSIYGGVIRMLADNLPESSRLPFELNPDGISFTIFYPFTRSPFLIGDKATSWFMLYILMMFLYGIFLWMLSNVFKGFKQPRLFIPKNVSRLRMFYLFNFIVPVLFIICMLVSGEDIRDAIVIVFLHIMIGVFAYFMAVIFKQGLLLQEEQDLTL